MDTLLNELLDRLLSEDPHCIGLGSTVGQVVGSKNGFKFIVGPDLSCEMSSAGMERTGTVDGADSSGDLDTLLLLIEVPVLLGKSVGLKLVLTSW